LALVLKSPTQMGWLSIINSVTNISRLGTFKGENTIPGIELESSMESTTNIYPRHTVNSIN
jgi:hypothetical protein